MSIPADEVVIVDEPTEYSHIFDRSPDVLVSFILQRDTERCVMCLKVDADTLDQITLLPAEANALRVYLNQPEVRACLEGR